jgi:rieske iron-sulfur protein
LSSLCLSAMPSAILSGQNDPAMIAPQADDVLVKISDDEAATPLTLTDVPANAPLMSAWPMDPVSKIVRKANRLNEVLLIRVDPKAISDSPSKSVEGVLAYSALCTHAGCNVNDWIPTTGILSCDCHQSEFDATSSGRVVSGPAARALPLLPLKLNDGVLAVAKPFATAIRFDG